MSDRATAIHEAGHAVAFARLSIRLQYVTIVPGGELLGGCVPVPSKLDDHDPDRYDAPRPHLVVLNARARRENLIRAALAGFIAEQRFTGITRKPEDDSWDHDRATAADLARKATICPEQYLAWLYAETERKVENWWPEIEAVADALIERRTLKSGEVRRAMTKAVVRTFE